jgi:hypothetical protein
MQKVSIQDVLQFDMTKTDRQTYRHKQSKYWGQTRGLQQQVTTESVAC